MKKFNFDQLQQILSLESHNCDYKLSQSQIGDLVSYIELLYKWNNVYNLTGIKTPIEMLQKHVFETLLIKDYLAVEKNQSIVDVGSGAGIPGLILAILNPDIKFELIDSNGKKTRFLLEAVGQLGLQNVKVTQATLPLKKDYRKYDIIISRAFANLDSFFACTENLAHVDTRWLAMKTIVSATELAGVPANFNLAQKFEFTTPNATTNLYIFNRLS